MATILRMRPAPVIRRATDPHPCAVLLHPETDGCLSSRGSCGVEVRGSRSGLIKVMAHQVGGYTALVN